MLVQLISFPLNMAPSTLLTYLSIASEIHVPEDLKLTSTDEREQDI